MNTNNEKVMEFIKGLPMFNDIIRQTEEAEKLKEQRKADIEARFALLENAQAENKRREHESKEAREKIAKCKEVYNEALEAGAAIERRHIAERYKFNTSLGTLEKRLRASAPKIYYKRLDEIEKELSRLYSKASFAAENDITRGKTSSQDLQASTVRASQLRLESDEIKRNIFEVYGLEESEDAN